VNSARHGSHQCSAASHWMSLTMNAIFSRYLFTFPSFTSGTDLISLLMSSFFFFLLLWRPLQKSPNSVVSRQVGMKFDRNIVHVNTHRVTESDFSIQRYTFKMAVITFVFLKICTIRTNDPDIAGSVEFQKKTLLTVKPNEQSSDSVRAHAPVYVILYFVLKLILFFFYTF